MADKKQIFQARFLGPVKNIGMITLIVAIICLFIPGLYLYFFHGLIPPFWSMVSAIVAVWSFMAIMGVVEPIVYYPILGFGGTYMSFLVGNVLNLRVPVSAAAQQVPRRQDAEQAWEPGVPQEVVQGWVAPAQQP